MKLAIEIEIEGPETKDELAEMKNIVVAQTSQLLIGVLRKLEPHYFVESWRVLNLSRSRQPVRVVPQED